MKFTGKSYFSGDSTLSYVRDGPLPEPTKGQVPIEMIARLPSEECGCPEEVWRIDNLILLFHFEDDGSSDVIIFAGDWELETHITARSLDDLRAKAFQWFADVVSDANG